MKRFYVYEVQEETRYRKWRYEVEAESEEAAVEIAVNGDTPTHPEDCGHYGDVDLGDSLGWSVGDGTDEGQRWADAADGLDSR